MLWNFVLHSLRRLLPDLWAKLACFARSDNALRSGAMLAHEENSNASAYSVWSDRTFYCTGYSTILINATRTLLTKACKAGFYLIVAFWLRFLFMTELIWAVANIFCAKPIQQEFRGGHAEQADTLEFSSCASIASTRRPLSECAKRTSLGRRVDNRRRSARSTKFHSVSAVLHDRPGTSDL